MGKVVDGGEERKGRKEGGTGSSRFQHDAHDAKISTKKSFSLERRQRGILQVIWFPFKRSVAENNRREIEAELVLIRRSSRPALTSLFFIRNQRAPDRFYTLKKKMCATILVPAQAPLLKA